MPYTHRQNKFKLLTSLQLFLLSGIVITIILNLLNLNSIFIVLLVFSWLLEGNFKIKWQLLKKDKLFLGYGLYFFIQIVGISQADSLYIGWKEAESKLGFFALPLVFCSSTFFSSEMRKKVMIVLSITVTLAGIYCVAIALFHYFSGERNPGLLFYHQLVSPLLHHAVYFAVFVFISLIFILFELSNFNWFKKNRPVFTTWIAFLVLLLFLLSSKMVLCVLLLFTVISLFQMSRKKLTIPLALISGIGFFLLILLIFVTDNPVKSRFVDMKGNIEKLTLEKYDQGMYFNPWEFRLLLWRFTYEIIDDERAWLTGVGPTNDQKLLQSKYVQMGLYSGTEARNDHGYLNFNCHNQFLQSLLESGIPGLLIFLFYCFMILIRVSWKKEKTLNWIVIVTFAFFFTESVFERQYGMLLTTLFPLMYLYSIPAKKNEVEIPSTIVKA